MPIEEETQANQAAQISTSFLEGELLLVKFAAKERLGNPFEIVAEVLSKVGVVDFQPHLGTGVGIQVEGEDDLIDRYFHGVLWEVHSLGPDEGFERYELTLRPWFSLLSLGLNTRIYQSLSVKDIIASVFKDANFTKFKMDLTSAGGNPRDYCVQFRESDFDFVSRLMEDEGIYYYFEHAADGHKMIFCDGPSCHEQFGGEIEIARGETEGIRKLHLSVWERRLQPAVIKATLWDSNFRKPGQPLEFLKEASSKNAAEAAEYYDYPGGYGYIKDDGTESGLRYVETRLQEERADRETYFGEGDVFGIPTGSTVSLKDGEDAAAKFLVTYAYHEFGPQNYGIGGAGVEPVESWIEFEAVPVATVWRPNRVTEKPLAGGPQTATVVGPAGEVIHVDEWGRVKVQFDWDRKGKDDEKSSCWLRVTQPWADAGFGMINIPRIGEEVVVDFFDGDPDRPFISGRVYNSEKIVPYALPAEKTKSTWKSKTVGAAGSYPEAEDPPSGDGFNELRFEDKGGSEEFFIHAQRIFNSWVRLDETRKTGRDTKVRVGRNRDVEIKKNETVTIEDGDETRTLKKGSRVTKIQKADTLTLSTGDYSMKVEAGQATIEAMQKITLKVGSNTIVISQQGIEIKGLMVKIKADTTMEVEGLMTTLKASAIMTISGAMVMIN